MMVSTKGRYALRIMVELARRENRVVSLKELAEDQDISLKYLESIAAMLHRSGLVRSQRGKDGGYALSRPPAAITAGEILRCTEGGLAPVACPSIQGKCCHREAVCLTLPLWRGLNEAIEGYLSSVTLQDLLEQEGIIEGE